MIYQTTLNSYFGSNVFFERQKAWWSKFDGYADNKIIRPAYKSLVENKKYIAIENGR